VCDLGLWLQWTERQIYSVLAIYEDRHELWGFKPDGTLLRRQLAASRQEELAGLTGWRARLSLLLEVPHPHPHPRNPSIECFGCRLGAGRLPPGRVFLRVSASEPISTKALGSAQAMKPKSQSQRTPQARAPSVYCPTGGPPPTALVWDDDRQLMTETGRARSLRSAVGRRGGAADAALRIAVQRLCELRPGDPHRPLAGAYLPRDSPEPLQPPSVGASS